MMAATAISTDGHQQGAGGGAHDPTEEETVVFSSPMMLNDSPSSSSSSSTMTLIILNSPIPTIPKMDADKNNDNHRSPCFDRLWERSNYRICADGGANRLYAYDQDLIPDRIRGDLDSLDLKVRQYYEGLGVSVEQDPSQDTNDLDKALQVCVVAKNHHEKSHTNKNGDNDKCNAAATTSRNHHRNIIVVYGAFGGRFDQEMASMQALYKWGPTFGSQIHLYSDETCAFLLPAETSCEIRLPHYGENCESSKNQQRSEDDDNQKITKGSAGSDPVLGEGPTCGLIPLGCRCESIVTDGFKWDLDGTVPMEFGGLVSTSNRVMKPTVKVRASHPLIFTAELTN